MFVVNSFTAIASKTTPKIFRIIIIPLFPIARWIFPDVFKTMYTKIILITIAIIIFWVSNSALKERSVVKLPGPANKGKANGNTEANFGLLS